MAAELQDAPLAGLQWSGSGEACKGEERVLCLHGWLDNAASFSLLAERLTQGADGNTTVAIDLPGHGKSGWHSPGQGYPIWGYTHELKTVIDTMASPVDLVAHSLGGSLALCLAAAFPETVRSIALLDSPGPMVTPENQIASQLRDGVLSRDKLRPSRQFSSIADAVAARKKATPELSESALTILVERNLAKCESHFEWRTDPQLKLTSDLRLSETQVEHLMRAVKCPVLSIRAESGLLPLKFFEHRMGYLQNVDSLQLPGHHHFHLEEETAPAIADAILTFWKGL